MVEGSLVYAPTVESGGVGRAYQAPPPPGLTKTPRACHNILLGLKPSTFYQIYLPYCWPNRERYSSPGLLVYQAGSPFSCGILPWSPGHLSSLLVAPTDGACCALPGEAIILGCCYCWGVLLLHQYCSRDVTTRIAANVNESKNFSHFCGHTFGVSLHFLSAVLHKG